MKKYIKTSYGKILDITNVKIEVHSNGYAFKNDGYDSLWVNIGMILAQADTIEELIDGEVKMYIVDRWVYFGFIKKADGNINEVAKRNNKGEWELL